MFSDLTEALILHCKSIRAFLTVWQLRLEWEVAYEAEDGSCHVDAPVVCM